MQKYLLTLTSLALAFTLVAHAENTATEPAKTAETAPAQTTTPVKKAEKNTTATIETTAGNIEVKLFPERAKNTVENFVGLATGKKTWKDPKTHADVKGKPLYSGTIFHRVIPGFMIQGGDPEGTGMGGPGYIFDNESKPTDSFDKPGILAMANAGPNTNGSQFFITDGAATWLNGGYTIFGEVTKGLDVVKKIASAKADASNNRPEKPVTIKKIVVR